MTQSKRNRNGPVVPVVLLLLLLLKEWEWPCFSLAQSVQFYLTEEGHYVTF